MSGYLSGRSLAQWFPEPEQHKCGYCKSSSGSISFGMLTESLTVEDYKDLIDRGWRRSGKYCYKPTMNETCCPQYAIRCDTTEFSLNKSHKKLVKKFNKFLNDGVFNKNVYRQREDDGIGEIQGFSKLNTIIDLNQTVTTEENELRHLKCKVPEGKPLPEHLSQASTNNGSMHVASCINNLSDSTNTSNVAKSIKKSLKEGTGADPTRPPCKKAKILRLERKKEKLSLNSQQLQLTPKSNSSEKTLKQFLEDFPATAKHKLKIVLERMDRNHDTYIKSAGLFKRYQMAVHNEPADECSQDVFYEFLVSTPLKHKPFPDGVDGPGYGSFHQQYWIDDKLIAVGVIDILPGCVSSVYFFYDPDYRDLTLGTYGSLREIELIQDLQNKIPDFKYYYMGFYIHSCPKMRYKGKLNPSYLLCPETYTWQKIDQCLAKLDVSKYSRLNEDANAIDSNTCTADDVNRIMIVYRHKLMYMKDFLRIYEVSKDEFNELAHLIGKKSALNIVFWVA